MSGAAAEREESVKMVAGSILCLSAVELAKGVLGGSIGGIICLIGASFLFLTGFGYVVIGAKDKKIATESH
jgi:hypothetical protein